MGKYYEQLFDEGDLDSEPSISPKHPRLQR
jgi:hypothetical protein